MTQEQKRLLNALNLIFKIADRYPEVEDGVAHGLRGLVKGLEAYWEKDRDNPLDTYLTWWIKNEIEIEEAKMNKGRRKQPHALSNPQTPTGLDF